MINLLFIGGAVLIMGSCSSSPSLSPEYSPGWQPPVATGIEIMSERGLRVGIWGSPDFPQADGTEGLLSMDTPYPNPSDGYFSIGFVLRRSANVKAWISPARGVHESTPEYSAGLGGALMDAGATRTVELLLDGSRELSQGVYQLEFKNGSETGDEPVPQGFYRVYVQANGVTLWRDIYVGYLCREAPAGLRKYLHYCADR